MLLRISLPCGCLLMNQGSENHMWMMLIGARRARTASKKLHWARLEGTFYLRASYSISRALERALSLHDPVSLSLAVHYSQALIRALPRAQWFPDSIEAQTIPDTNGMQRCETSQNKSFDGWWMRVDGWMPAAGFPSCAVILSGCIN